MKQNAKKRFPRRGFTLIELLTVLGIMMLLIGLVITVQPRNPEGLTGATRLADAVFQTARFKARQALQPDRDPEANPIYNIRSRVLILKDPENEEQHLRLFRVIVGGTRTPLDTSPGDYVWYGVDAGTMLPKDVYFVEPDNPTPAEPSRRSRISNKDVTGGNCIMNLDLTPKTTAQADGSGNKQWYFYEYNEDGTSNMNFAVLMVGEGVWNPASKRVEFANKNLVGGFAVFPNGNTISFTDPDEADTGNTGSK